MSPNSLRNLQYTLLPTLINKKLAILHLLLHLEKRHLCRYACNFINKKSSTWYIYIHTHTHTHAPNEYERIVVLYIWPWCFWMVEGRVDQVFGSFCKSWNYSQSSLRCSKYNSIWYITYLYMIVTILQESGAPLQVVSFFFWNQYYIYTHAKIFLLWL